MDSMDKREGPGSLVPAYSDQHRFGIFPAQKQLTCFKGNLQVTSPVCVSAAANQVIVGVAPQPANAAGNRNLLQVAAPSTVYTIQVCWGQLIPDAFIGRPNLR